MTKALRISITVIAIFIALTAIGGGIAILVGADKFPPEWLKGTPFKDYTIPALILTIIVGGSALGASVAVITRSRFSGFATVIASMMMTGYISVEVAILKQVPPGPTVIEVVYFVLGLILLVLGAVLWRRTSTDQTHASPSK